MHTNLTIHGMSIHVGKIVKSFIPNWSHAHLATVEFSGSVTFNSHVGGGLVQIRREAKEFNGDYGDFLPSFTDFSFVLVFCS